eukprot:4340983-Ditylum_brightwellii.AAC.1
MVMVIAELHNNININAITSGKLISSTEVDYKLDVEAHIMEKVVGEIPAVVFAKKNKVEGVMVAEN